MDIGYEIKYISVEHRIPALSYRIEIDGKSICYSGDTKPIESLRKIATDCDVFICESTIPDEMADFAHKHYHCTPSDAAEIADKANCNRLVLFHISSHFIEQINEFKTQAAVKFKKSIIIAEDLMEIEV